MEESDSAVLRTFAIRSKEASREEAEFISWKVFYIRPSRLISSERVSDEKEQDTSAADSWTSGRDVEDGHRRQAPW